MKHFALAIAFIFATVSAHAPASADTIEPGQISLKDLREKYADAGTRYITIDGAEIHYRDEGKKDGPLVVLLHASFFNLKTWDGVTDALKNDYRVIRFDFPNGGLSGPETTEPPGGKFSLIERNVDILEGLVDQLNLDKFALVATSSGGSVGFRYAARFPEHVSRLLLINSAGMPRTARTDPNRARSDVAQWADMPVKPIEYWQYTTGINYPSLEAAPEWVVELAHDVNRRTNTTPFSKYFFETGDPQGIVADIKAPTVIMWGMDNPTVVHLEADVFSYWMTSAPTMVKKYEGLGHYPYIEAPETVIPDMKAFLSGAWDDDLRMTQRVKVSP